MSQSLTTGKPWFKKDPFGQLVAILIAVTTMIVALLGYLDADASANATQAMRDAQRFNTQTMAVRNRGEVQVGYAWSDAYRQWLQMDALAAAARQRGDEAAAGRYLAARDRLARVSPLLAPPYFDPATGGVPDVNAYEADLYLVEATALGEQNANRMVAENAWRDKSTTYGTCMILFALVLFQFGLSTTMTDRLRWIPIGTGTLLAAASVLLAAGALLTPVPVLPEAAINAFARGVGLAYQDDHAAALQSFGQALDLAPSYANAYYERARSQFELANFDAAAADYRAAQAAGKDTVQVRWNLGWAYYRLGRFAESVEQTRAALELDEGQLALHCNLGLARLAQGDVEGARAAYGVAAALATQQVTGAHAAGEEPPETLWWYLSASGVDLDNLVDCLAAGACDRAAPAAAVSASPAVLAAAGELQAQLKNLATALEFTGQPPTTATAAAVASVAFVQPVYDAAGAVTAYAPLSAQTVRIRGAGVFADPGEAVDLALLQGGGASAVSVSFNYSGMQDGQLVVVKVYVDGRESVGLRLVQTWSLGAEGQAVLPLTPGGAYGLTPGEYRVEIYVDSQLKQVGSFTVPE